MHLLFVAIMRSILTLSGSRIIEPMIQLACCSTSHRIIVAGSKSRELVFELHRRGYTHVATTATCGLPRESLHQCWSAWDSRSRLAAAASAALPLWRGGGTRFE
jgi:hypothetical protein